MNVTNFSRSITEPEQPIKALDLASSQVETGESTSIPRKKKPTEKADVHQNGEATNGKNGTKPADPEVSSTKKRSAAEALDDSPSQKRSKLTNGNDQAIISIDDSADGAIVID